MARPHSVGSTWFAAAVVLAASVLAGCASDPGEAATAALATPTRASVTINEGDYVPERITVAAGGTVAWTNADSFDHTVTPIDKAAWGSEGSGDASAAWLQEGESWSFAFDAPGTYAYRCIPHSWNAGGEWRGQVGVVIVE